MADQHGMYTVTVTAPDGKVRTYTVYAEHIDGALAMAALYDERGEYEETV